MLIGDKPHDGCKTNLELANQAPYLWWWEKASEFSSCTGRYVGEKCLKDWVGVSMRMFQAKFVVQGWLINQLSIFSGKPNDALYSRVGCDLPGPIVHRMKNSQMQTIMHVSRWVIPLYDGNGWSEPCLEYNSITRSWLTPRWRRIYPFTSPLWKVELKQCAVYIAKDYFHQTDRENIWCSQPLRCTNAR